MLEVRLLGSFDLRLGGAPLVLASRPAQSLLAYLALSAGSAHRREKLAGLLWPDADDANARSNLRHALWRIRKVIESDQAAAPYLLSDDVAVSFNAGADFWLDVAIFTRDGETLQQQLDNVAVYRGELLPGFYDDWVTRERERLEALFDQKMQRLLDRLVEEARWPAVLNWGEQWVALGHAPEAGYRALMRAHSALGERSRAVATYQRCREALFNEMGVEPSLLTRRLYEQLRLAEADAVSPDGRLPPTTVASEHAPAAGDPPFQGLHYFDTGDADRFFGRESLTARLLRRVRTEPFLAIVGASGSGKSSVMRAGLVPGLLRNFATRADGWSARKPRRDVRVLTPTAFPLQALAACLVPADAAVEGPTSERGAVLEELTRDRHGLHRFVLRCLDSSQQLVLVVDQFEELFTLCHDAFEREAFVDNLLDVAESDGTARVVIALRADFYAHCADFPHLRDAMASHQEYVGALSVAELRRAIEGPAEQGDWQIDEGLTDLLLRDVGEEPGALPLLSHALLETWRRRRGRVLTLAGYAAAGGVQGAIAETAETVLTTRLTAAQRPIARRVFLHLTELGEGTQDTRRRVPMAELVRTPEEEADTRAVLQVLADARLITLDDGTAEVAHEALIREWPTLRAWLNQDREGLRLLRELSSAALEWERHGQDAGLLYRGFRLGQVLDLTRARSADLGSREHAFLGASEALAENEIAERDAQRERELDAARQLADTQGRAAEAARQLANTQRRTAAQLRQRAVLLAAAFVVAMAMALVSVVFGEQAQRNAATAQTLASVATSRELAASSIANLGIDPERSILLALDAVTSTSPPMPEARAALHRAIQASHVRLTLVGHSDFVLGAAFSPDGTRVATISRNGEVIVWNATSGAVLLSFTGQTPTGRPAPTGSQAGYQRLAFSPDGAHLAVGDGNVVRVVNASAGEAEMTFTGHTAEVLAITYSSDGNRLASADADGMVRVWDAHNGTALLGWSAHAGGIPGIAFSPDDSRLATVGVMDHSARIWDATTGRQLLALPGVASGAYATGVAFSPDGRRLATANGAQLEAVRVFDTTSGDLRSQFALPVEANTVTYSPDGGRLATGNFNGTASILDATTGQVLMTLAGHTGGLGRVAFSPDGTRLATASQDKTARIWDVTPDRELLTLYSDFVAINRVAYSPDGTRLASGSDDGTTRIWDAHDGTQVGTLAGHTGGIYGLAFSPDGSRIATASVDATANVWNAVTGEKLLTLSGHTDWIRGIAYSSDGTRLATGSYDGTARVWDAVTGTELLHVDGPGWVRGLAFSPDGGRLAVAYRDGSVAKVWSVGNAQELLTLAGHTNALWATAYSPDGTRIATASIDKTVRLWDAMTGQELLTLAGQGGPMWSVAFSPDGQYVAAGGADNTVTIWNVATGNEVQTLPGHASGIYGIAFSPDGKRLATASSDGTARVYALRLEDLIALGRSRLTRSWTLEECQQFLHVATCPD
jgi:WD40 repeat protein/DNA-binding SARP family transcriptional activator